jgi:hypothetical protein
VSPSGDHARSRSALYRCRARCKPTEVGRRRDRRSKLCPGTARCSGRGCFTARRLHLTAGRAVAALVAVVLGGFSLMLAMGGATFVDECTTVVCGQLHQAVFAAIGAFALFVAAYRVLVGDSAARIAFFGTIPISPSM